MDAPDAGDVTGILTVTDITEQVISDRIMHQLSVTSYDFGHRPELEQDTYTVLTCNENTSCLPSRSGCHSEHLEHILKTIIVPKDRNSCRLPGPGKSGGVWRRRGIHFIFIMDEPGYPYQEHGISAIDLRLGQVYLVHGYNRFRAEQQGFLSASWHMPLTW